MDLFAALAFGLLIGWAASVLWRTGTNSGILVDSLAGGTGAVALALTLGTNTVFDSLVAGYLGALVALLVLYLVRRQRSSGGQA